MIKPQALPSAYLNLTDALRDRTFRGAIADRVRRSEELLNPDYSAAHNEEYSSGITTAMLVEATRSTAEVNTRLFYCDKEMSSAIETGCRLFEESDKSDDSLLPSKTGFVYFAGGVQLTENMLIHGIYWYKIVNLTTGKDQTVVVGFNDTITKSDGALGSWRKSFEGRGLRVPDTRWVYRVYHHYTENVEMVIPASRIEEISARGEGLEQSLVTTNLSQVMHAFLLMVNQPPEIVTTSTSRPVNTKQVKRLADKKVPSDVTIIDIRHRRRSLTASSASSPVGYSRRWYVEGHWRWQWFKEETTGKSIQKRIWINSYIKGPDDKPFIATKRVYALLK